MASVLNYRGDVAAEPVGEWSHRNETQRSVIDRVILDLIEKLGYLPSEVAELLRIPVSRISGTFWRARFNSQRLAARLSRAVDAKSDPRHLACFALAAVCEYSFVELGAAFGLDHSHASRAAGVIGQQLRSRLQPPEPPLTEDDDEHDGLLTGDLSFQLANVFSTLPGGDDVDLASDDKAARWHFATNERLRGLERAELWSEMLEAKDFDSRAALARALNVPRFVVAREVWMVRLPDVWVDRVRSGQLPWSFLRPVARYRNEPKILAALSKRFAGLRPVPNFAKWCEIVKQIADEVP